MKELRRTLLLSYDTWFSYVIIAIGGGISFDEFKRNDVMSIAIMSKHSNRERQEPSSQWVVMAEQLIDKFVGKNMSMTYKFDNLTIDIPRAHGPNGNQIGSAQWIINGKIIITTETYEGKRE
jgi:hypothetical protein